MKLSAAALLVAQELQESADQMSAGDTRSALSDAVDAMHKDGGYGYVLDHYGDDESGDVVYRSSGKTIQAPYSMAGGNGFARKATIDSANAMDVRGRMVYEPMQDEAEHYAAMSEAFTTAKIYTEIPVYERFVSKADRDAADDSDFAGKGKSFPILKREDVMAAVRSIGRAGSGNSSGATIKANIIAIAKRKGWTDELPKSWRGAGAKESSKTGSDSGIRLVETMAWAEELLLSESVSSGVEREIRIIVPCTGSSAVYTEAALKKSAAAFPVGTQMFINHATRAEESERPEGDWRKLVGQLTSQAVWKESHKNGPALYANAKFVSSMAPEIIEKASMSGVSIKASGRQAMEAGRPVVKNGLPVLDEITHVESVDIVTKAGAGGVILTESARAANLNEGAEVQMTEAEVKTLKESLAAQTAINERLLKRALRADAVELAGAVLGSTSLNEAQRKFVIESVLGTADQPREIAVKEGGILDATKLTEAVNAAAKSYSATLPATGGVRGMGAGLTIVAESAEVKAAREASVKESQAVQVRSLMELGLSEKAAKESVGVAA